MNMLKLAVLTILFFAAFCKKEPVALFFTSTLSANPMSLSTVTVTYTKSPCPNSGGSRNFNGIRRKRRRIYDGILGYIDEQNHDKSNFEVQ